MDEETRKALIRIQIAEAMLESMARWGEWSKEDLDPEYDTYKQISFFKGPANED